MRRVAGNRPLRGVRIIVVACDGERTESDYFRSWRQVLGHTKLQVKPLNVRSGGNPYEAVRQSVKLASREDECVEFWCVTDVDNASSESVRKAEMLAQRHGLNLCLSKRCFELWIMLHWAKTSRVISSERDAIEQVRQYIDDYAERVKVAPFDLLFPRTEIAIANAAWLRETEFNDPMTDVDLLVQKFLNALGS